ncbi:MAG: bifunctional diaminohydroxyphosphoribosylaminopyrimidine deaminase/5-amino-6-(5-phosphoribosylamino)uracil reductase RibD, partial [Paracoccaceae bacterium]
MTHALGLAARGLGGVWPNPAVGCVIVKDGRVLGRGVTQPGGRPHAERVALAQAGATARGATVYVTLEPCAHHGQTGPCAEALISAGVARVVTGMTDPDPRVSGRGHAMLRAAGIEVTEGVCADQARAVTAGFVKRVALGLPFVTLKLASSFDGRTALADGSSRWITGPDARRMVHAMRLRHDAVMVGAGTAIADDPELTVRGMGASRQPVRVVMDRGLRVPASGRLGQTAAQIPVWMLHADGAAPGDWAGTGATLIAAGAMSAREALAALATRGITRVFCEGGATLAASLLADDLVDEVVMFTAGIAIGSAGFAAVAALPPVPLAERTR